jgi:hypothetical protein
MRYYLCGPMSGLPEFGYDRFEKAAKFLRELGLDVVSPHEIEHHETKRTRGKTKEYKDYLVAGIVSMLGCNAIILLPGWSDSFGAKQELELALACRHKVFYFFERDDKWELLEVT